MDKELVDTIVAIATPSGKGGVGIVRVSGPKVEAITKVLLKQKLKPRIANFSLFYNVSGEVLDQGLAIYFQRPNSFTGEDVLELHAHGNPFLLDQILQTIVNLGARLARPGEFSERAFMNGKIDLAQAEATADLIAADSTKAVRSAIRSLQGEFSKKINLILELITKLRVYIEAAIDFSEEEIDYLDSTEINNSLQQIFAKIAKVKRAAEQGLILRDGCTIVIVGKPNAGKSSLLNILSGRDSAIITDIAGTTRDVLREYIQVDGMPIHAVDTAGLQQTDNVIEKEGIKRTWKEIEQADVILLIADESLTKEIDPEILLPDFCKELQHKQKVVVIKNKIDLSAIEPKLTEWQKNHKKYKVIYLSAKTGAGVGLLKQHLKSIIGVCESCEGNFIARRRHIDALEKTEKSLIRAQQLLAKKAGIELIAEELRISQLALGEITGKFTSENLLDEIFSSFCIGK